MLRQARYFLLLDTDFKRIEGVFCSAAQNTEILIVPYYLYFLLWRPKTFWRLLYWWTNCDYLSLSPCSYLQKSSSPFRIFLIYQLVVQLLTDLLYETLCCCVSCSIVSDSLRPHRLWATKLLCPWDSPGKNTGVDCHALLQGVLPTQELKSCLLLLQTDSLPPELSGKSCLCKIQDFEYNHQITKTHTHKSKILF